MAVRKSVTARPLRLNDAELEMRSSRAASAGSEPTTRTTCSREEFGSDRMRRTRTAISGNDGRSTLPPDNSAANDLMKSKATSEGVCNGMLVNSRSLVSLANRPPLNTAAAPRPGNRQQGGKLEGPWSNLAGQKPRREVSVRRTGAAGAGRRYRDGAALTWSSRGGC